MVGIITSTEDALLASVDQLDLLGLSAMHKDKPLDWLQKRAKKVQFLLHPDKLLDLPIANDLPYQAIHANAVAEFLKAGITKGKSQEPAADLILFRFWQHAANGHRVRWRPFDEQDQPRSIHDTLLCLPQATKTTTTESAARSSDKSQTFWFGERERRPYGGPPFNSATTQQETATAGDDAECSDCEPSADDPLSSQDEQIRLVAASFPLGKLFTLANHKDGRRFVFARTRLRQRAGRAQRWALVTAAVDKNGSLRLNLCPRDINVRGNVVHQKLHQGSAISWERMSKGGFFGLGRFGNATKEDVHQFAAEQSSDMGSS